MSVPMDQLNNLVGLPASKRARAFARFAVIEAGAKLAAVGSEGRRGKLAEFCHQYNAGQVKLPEGIRKFVPKLTVSTFYRWEGELSEGGVAALGDGYGNRAGSGLVESSPDLQQYLRGILFLQPHVRALRAVEIIQSIRSDLAEGLTERVVQGWLNKWRAENAQLYTYVSHPDEWKSRFLAAHGNADGNIVRLNQFWELDSTPADVMLVDGRHSILGNIDVYSRRFKLLVSKTSKAVAISALVRKSMLDWGIPEGVRTDQGQDYTSEHLRGVLRMLEIDHKLCLPFASQQKPFIERAFRTLSHGLFEGLDGYIGHSVADAQRLRSRATFAERLMEPDCAIEVRMDAPALQKFCDDWTSTIYEKAAHAGLDGATPFSRVTGWTGEIRRISADKERALDVLLAEAPDGGSRSVLKKGLSIGGAWFIAPELTPLIGQRVAVKLDATDRGRVFVYEGDGQFLCIARSAELEGISLAEEAKVAQKVQREAMSAGRKAMKEAGALVMEAAGGNLVEAVLAHRREQQGNVIALPRMTEEHSTPALEEAGKAAAALAALPPSTVTALPRPAKVVDEDLQWKDQQWARFKALEGKEQVSDEDASWMAWFENSPTYRSRKMLEESAALQIRRR